MADALKFNKINEELQKKSKRTGKIIGLIPMHSKMKMQQGVTIVWTRLICGVPFLSVTQKK